MNYFLKHDDHQKLVEMSLLRSTKYINSKGTKVSGKLFLLGENIAKLSGISLKKTVNDKYYIVLTFTRKAANILGLKTKVTFAPHLDFVFDHERASDICTAFGHELKPKPEDMEMNIYMTHVARRFRTFMGRDVNVLVSYTKEPRKTPYGFVKQRVSGFNETCDITDFRQKMAFYSVDSQVQPDWTTIENMFYNIK